MTLQELKEQATALPPGEFDEFATFIVQVCEERDENSAEELGRLLRDPDPNHWGSLEEAEAEFGIVAPSAR
jgi:hypothetical protein